MTTARQNARINVVYQNGVKDSISPGLLNTLIRSKQVTQFERSSGWVTIGKDAIRGMGGSFSGIERRGR